MVVRRACATVKCLLRVFYHKAERNTMDNIQNKEQFVSEFQVEELEDRLEFREWTLEADVEGSCTSGQPCTGSVSAGASVTF